MAKRIAGTCYFKVDGETLELEGSLEFPMNKFNRESLVSTSGVAGYSETVVKPYLKGNFFVPKNFPTKKIVENNSMTIVAECANGMVYTLIDAYTVGEITYKPMDGTVELTFDGVDGDLS